MDERERVWERRFEVPVLIAALLVVPVIVVEQSEAGEPWRTGAVIANWSIWLLFALELVVMLAVVRDRWRWLRRHPLEVAIVVLTPPFLPASWQAARVLRLLRLLRLLPAVFTARRLFTLEGVRWAALLALATALGGGAAYAAAEGGDVNTWDGLWWAVTTMTTVGYGDMYPKTDLGRAIAIGVMLVGIGFIAIITAALAQRFVAQEVAEVQEEVTEEIEAAEEGCAPRAARHCPAARRTRTAAPAERNLGATSVWPSILAPRAGAVRALLLRLIAARNDSRSKRPRQVRRWSRSYSAASSLTGSLESPAFPEAPPTSA